MPHKDPAPPPCPTITDDVDHSDESHQSHGPDLPVREWLLSSATTERGRALAEWRERGVTVLPTGLVYSAIRISERIVLTAAGLTVPDADDPCGPVYAAASIHLRDHLGGPVIHTPRWRRYYALVPLDGLWWGDNRYAERVGHDAYLGVPRPELTHYVSGLPAYWAVAPREPGDLCTYGAVNGLIDEGVRRIKDIHADYGTHYCDVCRADGQQQCPEWQRLHAASEAVRREQERMEDD